MTQEDIQNLSDESLKLILGNDVRIQKKKTFDNFYVDGTLGKGAFGTVYRAQLKRNMELKRLQLYALKRVPKQLLIRNNLVQDAFHERNILSLRNCKFIVSLIMAFQDSLYLYLVMEYAMGGQTYSLIQKSSQKFLEFKNLGQQGIRFIAGCVVLGLQFLHKNNYMHRDIKPENLLMFQNGYVKLTDFGSATRQIDGEVYRTIKGTILYCPPEMILNRGYCKAVDLWALGILLYQFSNYQPPFSPQEIISSRFQAVSKQAEAHRTWKNKNISEELKNLIDKLLRYDEKQRLGHKSWDQVKNHIFFKEFNWKELEQQKMKSPLQKIVKKFPVKVKHYKPQPTQAIDGQNNKIAGWTVNQ